MKDFLDKFFDLCKENINKKFHLRRWLRF